jgi:hypothetical protein
MLADDFGEGMDLFMGKLRGMTPQQMHDHFSVMKANNLGNMGSFNFDPAVWTQDISRRYAGFGGGIRGAQRFVLSPMVVEAAEDFADTQKVVSAALDYVFLPAEITWIEWRGGHQGNVAGSNRHGLLLMGQGEGKAALSVGQGAYVFDGSGGRPLHRPIHFDLHDYVFRNTPVPGEILPDEVIRVTHRMGRFLVCALALINTPRISQLIEHNIDEKLNRARVKRGKVPLLSWRDVTIRPDVGWSPKPTHQEGSTGEKRRHHVRTFMRLKMGKVEIVKPHWRGNREKGYVLHRHVVRMDGEEAGAWKGEPLPGTRILKPTDEVPED